MSINKVRKMLYTSAKLLGDVNAINRGKIGRRIQRRIAGKVTGRLLNNQKQSPLQLIIAGIFTLLFRKR